jgi:hypothetical protein
MAWFTKEDRDILDCKRREQRIYRGTEQLCTDIRYLIREYPEFYSTISSGPEISRLRELLNK